MISNAKTKDHDHFRTPKEEKRKPPSNSKRKESIVGWHREGVGKRREKGR